MILFIYLICPLLVVLISAWLLGGPAPPVPPQNLQSSVVSQPIAATKPSSQPQSIDRPSCPVCGKPMVKRTNRMTKEPFWGCSDFFNTGCRGSRSIEP